MEVVDLDKTPQYDALSYTWADENGNNAFSEGIFLGPEWLYFPVTVNCSAALRRLRHRRLQRRRVWIDSICIDQHNVQERTHQVGLMSIIYSTARTVIMYVGEDTCGSDQNGLKFMSLVREAREGYGIATELSGCDRRSASQFFSRPYFSRLWIIQEVALSRSAHLCCAGDVIPWSKFRPERLKIAGVEESQVPSWVDLTSLPQSRRSWRTADLPRILLATSQCKSSDPRDRIFALLGLFGYSSISHTHLKPDYSISTRETFIGTAAFLLDDMGLDYVLKLSNIRPRERTDELPSWVPTWTQKLSDLSCTRLSGKLSGETGLKRYFWQRHPGSLVAILEPHSFTSQSSAEVDMDFYGIDEDSGGLVVTGVEVFDGSILDSCSASSTYSGVNFHYYYLPHLQHKIGVLPRYDQNNKGKYDWYPEPPEDRIVPGDRVVAIRGCDELLHLRPRRKHGFFEIIGTGTMAMIAPEGYDMRSQTRAEEANFSAEDMDLIWILEYIMFSSSMVATDATTGDNRQEKREKEFWTWCLECNEAFNRAFGDQKSTAIVTRYLARWKKDATLPWRTGQGQLAWSNVLQLYHEWVRLWQSLSRHAEACGLSPVRLNLPPRSDGPTLKGAPPELLRHTLDQTTRTNWSHAFIGRATPSSELLADSLEHWKIATVALTEILNRTFLGLDVGVTFNEARIPLTSATAREITGTIDWRMRSGSTELQAQVELQLGDWSEIDVFIQVLKVALSGVEQRVQRLSKAINDHARSIVRDILSTRKSPRRYVLL